jgi:hypothetical protein
MFKVRTPAAALAVRAAGLAQRAEKILQECLQILRQRARGRSRGTGAVDRVQCTRQTKFSA